MSRRCECHSDSEWSPFMRVTATIGLRGLRGRAQLRYAVGMSSDDNPGEGLLGEESMLITQDGRHLRTMVRGDGTDLVVFEAGMGISGLYWGAVHERLAAHAQVVACERAGYGGSDPDHQPRTLAHLVADLETVINVFPHRRLVLVGHSWGGPTVRVVAALRLKRGQPVTGIVLVDQTDENSGMYFSRTMRRQFSAQAALMVPLARLRILGTLSRRTIVGLPEPIRDAVIASSCTPTAARATAAEQRHVIDGLQGLHEAPAVLGDLPVRVISGQRSGTFDTKARTSIIRAHKETVAQNPGAHFVPAEHSGHMVPVTEPGLVATEVLAILNT